jgi:tetratricopeptide (TPR) repeat protein
LRARSGRGPQPAAPAQPVAIAPEDHEEVEKFAPTEAQAPPTVPEEAMDDDTQKFIAQALTDVDLFSSYGLTQKATALLETVLERAPRHTPTLERLLDFYLGAGNERRTAELASQLEQIYSQRGDQHNSERFSELRMRFQTAAGMTAEELPAAPPAPAPLASAEPVAEAAPAAPIPEARVAPVAPAVPPHAGPAEFEISLVPLEEENDGAAAQPAPAASHPAPTQTAPPAPPVSQVAQVTEEVDLSDEWEAMLKDTEEPAAEPVAAEAPAEAQAELAAHAEPEPVHEAILDLDPVVEPETQAAPVEQAHEELVPEITIEEEPAAPGVQEFSVAPIANEELDPVIEPAPEAIAEPEPAAVPAPEPVAEVEPEPEPVAAADNFEFELVEEPAASKGAAQTTDDLISELVAEFDDVAPAETPKPQVAQPVAAATPKETHRPAPEIRAASHTPIAAPPPPPAIPESVPPVTADTLNQLSEVFQEFRDEFGGQEEADENEDLETHYNLGIAYREMGLLDEAIGEFQKVAKAVQKGKPFQYAMNCSTLLALSFNDKGEPKIAALWYQRALETPGLEQESVLALRYDLGVSLEQAGESRAALDSFRQVYAMNIDYRDVADRIAVLQKR